MKNYFDEIKTKIQKKIEIENIEIIDNSYKHVRHKSFSPDKFHLELKIKSSYLQSISRINAHKLIMKILSEDLKIKFMHLKLIL